MEAHKKNIAALMDKANAMQARYPSAETANLAKDAVVLSKKFDSVLTRGEKIEDMLEGTLEQHATDAQQQQNRWLNAVREKMNWCGDIAGDRYSVEAKLATIVVSQKLLTLSQHFINCIHKPFCLYKILSTLLKELQSIPVA